MIILFWIFLFFPLAGFSAKNAVEKNAGFFKREKGSAVYKLSVDYKSFSVKGFEKKAMAINGSIPAPTLRFKEGEKAVIYVTNNMDAETSIHWHGILLPNFEDGVPYLTSPPIRPGKTHRFEFKINQYPGTYWYHSHTGLQEQEGLYGAFVIEPKRKQINYNKELILVLSDWTNEDPDEIMRSLKRGSEWHSIKKGTVISFFDVLKRGALGAQLKMWGQRMPGMDISDVYYPAFLINGKTEQHYPQFKAGDRVRLRVVNAAASTYFWLTFGGGEALLVSADGVNVQPVLKDKILHAIAETYDFILKIPANKALEFKASAEDGSGTARALIGKGGILKAPDIPKPDLIEGMKAMAQSHRGHGHSGHGGQKSHKGHTSHSGHGIADSSHNKNARDANQRAPQSAHESHKGHGGHNTKQSERHKSHSDRNGHKKSASRLAGEKASHPMAPPLTAPHYSYLKALEKTSFSKSAPLREIRLNLTGNMWRYVWSFNGKVLSSADKIKIRRGEIARIILNNKTMMRHPMHLHGHFFRVLNKNGEYSPLKHTVDVPPMAKVVIEFDAKEKGDWLFHCHILYHMKGGMTRVFSYGDKRDERLKDYPLSRFLNGDRQWLKWAETALMSHRWDLSATASNTNNKLFLENTLSWFDGKYSWRKDFEAEAGYERFLSDFFRLYGGVEFENKAPGDIKDIEFSARLGLKYLLPYFVDLDLSLSHLGEARARLDYELMIFSRWELFAKWESSFNALEPSWSLAEHEWELGLEYIMSRDFSLIGSYSNHFGWGAGLGLRL